MGPGYPPPTRSRLAPLWADFGGSRSSRLRQAPRAGNRGHLVATIDVQGRLRRRRSRGRGALAWTSSKGLESPNAARCPSP